MKWLKDPGREANMLHVLEWKAFVGLAVLSVAGCGGTSGGSDSGEGGRSPGGEITVVGSTTVQPVAEVLAGAFESLNPGVVIDVQGGGSSVGVTSAGQGTADIGNVSRDVKQDELDQFPGLVVHTIARDGIAIVANPDVTVSDLSIEQIRGIFSGGIDNWTQVGGTEGSIVVVSREEGSGTRGAFEELVLGEGVLMTETAILQPSNGAILTTVASTPASVAYLSFGYMNSSVKAISIDGVEPTPENAASGAYPIVRPLNMVTDGEPEGLVRAFIDFIYSADGQAIVEEEGYLPAR
jgi:phosphate transport system substrate-binding protein